jgi:hypothetical protein
MVVLALYVFKPDHLMCLVSNIQYYMHKNIVILTNGNFLRYVCVDDFSLHSLLIYGYSTVFKVMTTP